MQKSWYMLNECQQSDEYTDEYNEKMKFYEEICAHKKPYFFAYNYKSLMTEYRETVNIAKTNARLKFKMELDDMIEAYDNNTVISEDHRVFVEKFKRKIKLDNAKSTCNMICWEFEKMFDGKVGFAPDAVDAYSLLRSGNDFDNLLLDKIIKVCKKSEQKRASNCVMRVLLDQTELEDGNEYENVEYDIADVLLSICNNEDMLCDLLLEYCYKHGGSKEILWTVCGETIVKRLMACNDMFYPVQDANGDFEVQGKRYAMRQYMVGGEEDEI